MILIYIKWYKKMYGVNFWAKASVNTRFDIFWVCVQVAAGVQVRLHQPVVSAGSPDLAQRCRHHLSGRVWVPAQIPEQVRQHILVCQQQISLYSQVCKWHELSFNIAAVVLLFSRNCFLIRCEFCIGGSIIVILEWEEIKNELIQKVWILIGLSLYVGQLGGAGWFKVTLLWRCCFLLQERRLRDSGPVGQTSPGLVLKPLEPLVHRHALRHLHRAPHGPRWWESGLSLSGRVPSVKYG